MTTQIIVGYNGAGGGEDALALALVLADTAPEHDVQVTVVAVAPDDPVGLPGYEAAFIQDAEERLRSARDACRERDGVTFEVRASSSPARALHWAAEDVAADMIVVGRSHTGLVGRAFTGSVTEQTVHGASCPVAVAPVGYATGSHRVGTVAAAYTGTTESRIALDRATHLARDRAAALLLVRVIEPLATPYGGLVDPYPLAALRRDVAAELDAAAALVAGVEVRTAVLDGEAVHVLSHLEGADLLVLGSRELGPVGRVLAGSVSSRLARHCETPILIVPRSVDTGDVAVPASSDGAGVGVR